VGDRLAVPMVALMLTLTASTAPDDGALFGYLTMIVALTAVFLGVKHYRDKVLGGGNSGFLAARAGRSTVNG
jgi:hypothetical protein